MLQLASRWVKSGRKVTVYLRMEAGNYPEKRSTARVEERVWKGVRLLSTASFNPLDTFSTLIVWRSMEILDEPNLTA